MVVSITVISHMSLCVKNIKTVCQITMKDFYERATLVLKSVGYILFNPVNICPRHITCLIGVGGGGESIKKTQKVTSSPCLYRAYELLEAPKPNGKIVQSGVS